MKNIAIILGLLAGARLIQKKGNIKDALDFSDLFGSKKTIIDQNGVVRETFTAGSPIDTSTGAMPIFNEAYNSIPIDNTYVSDAIYNNSQIASNGLANTPTAGFSLNRSERKRAPLSFTPKNSSIKRVSGLKNVLLRNRLNNLNCSNCS